MRASLRGEQTRKGPWTPAYGAELKKTEAFRSGQSGFQRFFVSLRQFPRPTMALHHLHTAVCALLLLAGALSSVACRQDEVRTLSESLDRALADKSDYDARKEARINELRQMRAIPEITPHQEYDINTELYREFKKYRLDSAIRYIERNVTLGRQLDNQQYIIESELRLARLYSSSGMSIEARTILESIDPATLPGTLRHIYYRACSQFYQHYAALTDKSGYNLVAQQYTDSMLLAGQTHTLRYRLAAAGRYSEYMPADSVEKALLRLFNEIPPEDSHHAEAAYMLGNFYYECGDESNARKYYLLSALTDVRLSIKENASFQALAVLFYNDGNLAQAFKYSQAAIEDALFSKVQFRTAQMSELYSIISASHQAKEVKSKNKLQYYLALISILSAVLVLLFAFVFRQMRKLYRVKEELSRINGELARLNDELAEKNEQLSEANTIKMQYIARFFDLCSMYIDKMDDYRKRLKKLAQDQKYDLLYRQLKSTSMLETEQGELYKNFDAIFLNLYPSFVEDFNALLNEDERIKLRSKNLLNKELRIYALLRLGITDSVKIASFLRCSLSTVYNYRTKIRNKASVSRETFEKMVMKIGSNRHSEG